jgi:hypothetical protein
MKQDLADYQSTERKHPIPHDCPFRAVCVTAFEFILIIDMIDYLIR